MSHTVENPHRNFYSQILCIHSLVSDSTNCELYSTLVHFIEKATYSGSNLAVQVSVYLRANWNDLTVT